jgi:hypothetical protein
VNDSRLLHKLLNRILIKEGDLDNLTLKELIHTLGTGEWPLILHVGFERFHSTYCQSSLVLVSYPYLIRFDTTKFNKMLQTGFNLLRQIRRLGFYVFIVQGVSSDSAVYVPVPATLYSNQFNKQWD